MCETAGNNARRRRCRATFYKLLSAVSQNTNFIVVATADMSVLSETSDETFLE